MNRPQSAPRGPDSVKASSTGAQRVALGMLLSRALGFVREIALAYFFGVGPHADVFRTALRGPNLLQNLLGEQSLSASFIPIYSRMIEQKRYRDARRFAGAIFGLLLALAAGLSLIGVILAPVVVTVVAPGYLADAELVDAGSRAVDRFPLAVTAVRVMFPMAGILVLSAWALGVLNSHRRFFLPYMAPALWNGAIIAALVLTGLSLGDTEAKGLDHLLIAGCVGALIGGLLQFGIQLPLVFRCLGRFPIEPSLHVPGVRDALSAFVPLLAGRGAVQLSSYLDLLLASFLAAGALAALGYAQTLYLLPIGLFAMSVAAAELPELSRTIKTQEIDRNLDSLKSALARVGFLTVPTALGYVVFGFLIVQALFRRGSFEIEDNWLVYLVLCAYSSGLVASASSRLLNNVFFAQGRTGIPARVGVERVLVSGALGATLMLYLDRYSVGEVVGLGVQGSDGLRLGAVGLALGAGVSAWFELWRLLRSLGREFGNRIVPWSRLGAMLGLSVGAAIVATAVWAGVAGLSSVLNVTIVLGAYAASYLLGARVLGWPELEMWTEGLRLLKGWNRESNDRAEGE